MLWACKGAWPSLHSSRDCLHGLDNREFHRLSYCSESLPQEDLQESNIRIGNHVVFANRIGYVVDAFANLVQQVEVQ